MRIERSLAQSREMFAAAKHGGISQPAQKLARVGNHLLRIVRNRPRTHHLSRSLVGQIEHRRKSTLKPIARQFSPITRPCLR